MKENNKNSHFRIKKRKKETKSTLDEEKRANATIKSNTPITTLNVNGLNTPIKR